MVIKGNKPQLVPTHSRGQFVWYFYKDGRVSVRPWPRKRGNNISEVTKRQVVVWDAVQVWLPRIAPSEHARAYRLTGGTAFYARDMLIMAAYGHHFSWPGHGTMPDGPPLPPP